MPGIVPTAGEFKDPTELIGVRNERQGRGLYCSLCDLKRSKTRAQAVEEFVFIFGCGPVSSLWCGVRRQKRLSVFSKGRLGDCREVEIEASLKGKGGLGVQLATHRPEGFLCLPKIFVANWFTFAPPLGAPQKRSAPPARCGAGVRPAKV